MGGQEVVVNAWKECGIQALVLLSFILQVTLLVLAEFRRRVRSGVLMFFIWSAYMMADATAIYVMGHMVVTTSRSPEHQLVAFWAPFLLLHLGGQDNITAYAIEDNRLWLRHLQTLAVQVVAAAHVLYESSIITGGRPFLRRAAILMFLVGAVKYGERVRALWLAGRSGTGNSYKPHDVIEPDRDPIWLRVGDDAIFDTEVHVAVAHRMLNIPKTLLMGSPTEGRRYCLTGASLFKVVEMQLSLMHDIFYTKTQIIHSNRCGICIRVISAVATATALHLFNHHHKDNGYNRVDVAVTYVLLVGAVVLETLSLLRAAFSRWRFYSRKDSDIHFSRQVEVSCVRLLVCAAGWRGRGWSASMGQHNLLQLSAGSRASRRSKMARWMGLEDLWNRQAYSWSIPVSYLIERTLVEQLFKKLSRERFWNTRKVGGEEERDEERGEEAVWEDIDPGDEAEVLLLVWDLERKPTDTINQVFDSRDPFHSRVPWRLKRWGLYMFGLTRSVEERILIWHIATNIYLAWWYEEQERNACDLEVKYHRRTTAEAAAALSNYLVFLLAARPDMLSPTGNRTAYVEVCYALTNRSSPCETIKVLAEKLRNYGDDMLNRPVKDRCFNPRAYGFDTVEYRLPMNIQSGCKLGAMLIRKHTADTLDDIFLAWVETLFYAGLCCSAYAHAKQLSNGGELITIAAFLVEYLKRDAIVFVD